MRVFIRRGVRLTRLTVHLGVGLLQASLMFGLCSTRCRDRAISLWAAKLLRLLGVRLEADSPPAFPDGVLLVANHISWLDVFVILATHRVHFVSKHEVRSWPLVGWLAWRAGTLFIQRAKKNDTLRINEEMQPLLQEGAWVAIFPEGTSTDGRKLLRFLPSLFQPAVNANLPVLPAALRYQTADGVYTDAAVYADALSFGQSLWRITGEAHIVARLQFCLPVQEADRRKLAETAYRQIAGKLADVLISTADAVPGNPPGSPAGHPDAMPSTAPPTDSPYPG